MQDYYTREVDENGNITFKSVDFDHVKICGYTLGQVEDILRGLDIERAIGISLTLDNLQILWEKCIDEQRKMQEKYIARKFKESE